MPAEKTIRQLYLDHEHAFLKHLARARRLKEKDIHQLRVEIKNLRVLSGFFKVLTGKEFKAGPLLKLIKPVFEKAGQVRTLHLNMALTAAYRSAIMLRFKGHLLQEEKKAGQDLVKEINRFDRHRFKSLHKKNKRTLEKLKPGTVRKESEAYLRRIFIKLHKRIFDLEQDDVLHQARKRLKTIKSMRQLLAGLVSSPAVSSALKKTESIYQTLGEWHDGVVLAKAFENYVHKKESPGTQAKATTLLLKLIEKNEKNKLQVIRKLKAELK